jgi:predicted signal transduction protein with EAL and GGDEF domain
MTESVEDRALVKSLIDLSSALGLTVVAEGVENKVVHEMLVDLGCPMGQGWFYGRPTSAARLAQSLGAILPGGAQHTGEHDLGLEDTVERRLALSRPVAGGPEKIMG